jgi:Ca2+/Na+ antiporter
MAATFSGLTLFTIGAGLLCAAAVTATTATSQQRVATPTRRTLLHWLPVAITVLIARFMGWPQVAVGLIFGTSVAMLTTGLGSIATIAPVGPAPQRWRRMWPFTLVTSILVCLCGFNGLLTWPGAVALYVEALIIFSLWFDPPSDGPGNPTIPDAPSNPWSMVWIVPVIALAAIGAFIVGHALHHLRETYPQVSPGAVAASLLSLMLVMPIVQSDRQLARRGESWVAVTSAVGLLFLNLCVLLPTLAAAQYVKAIVGVIHLHPLVIDPHDFAPHAMVYPWGVWRLDAMLLLLVSAMFLPATLGKWNLGRRDGLVLIFIYVAYLLIVTVAAT